MFTSITSTLNTQMNRHVEGNINICKLYCYYLQ